MQNIPWWVPVIVVAVILIWIAALYNVLVRLRNHVRESFADIDTELKRRYDLIPRLVETVKGYAKHEREVLERVTAARNQMRGDGLSVKELGERQHEVAAALKTLFAVSERYPDLKASGNFLQLQQELANTEDRIQAARRFYNANVRDLNTRVQSIPTNILAAMFGFKTESMFELESIDMRTAPKVELT